MTTFNRFNYALAIAVLGAVVLPASAHDSWVQANTNMVQTGQVVHVDLILGNHGNHHRDFRFWGKVDPDHATLDVLTPDGDSVNLVPELVDLGSEQNAGYWSARLHADDAGLYTIAHTYDRVVHYAPVRSIKSAKTFFIATQEPGQLPEDVSGFDRELGHPLELVPRTNPAAFTGPPVEMKVQLLFRGEPLEDARVSFIPRGQELEDHFDENYERRTDDEGVASFTAEEGNYYLIIATHEDPNASGELDGDTYEKTKFSAALVVYVP